MATNPSARFRCLRRAKGNSRPAKANVDAKTIILELAPAFAATVVALTVIFTVPGLTPWSVTEFGTNAQVSLTEGRFPQQNDTVCVEPPRGITLIVAVPLWLPARDKLAGLACKV